MGSQDIIKMSNKAKSETEAFINCYLNDHAKGWPKNSFAGSDYADYRQEQQGGRRKKSVCSQHS